MKKFLQKIFGASIIILFFASGCAKDGPSLVGSIESSTEVTTTTTTTTTTNPGPSSVTLTDPGTIYQGGQYTFSGTCAPNGTQVSISLTSATPSQIQNCTCSNGTFSCPATTLTVVPSSSITVEAQNDRGDTSQVSVSTVIPSVTLTDPGYLTSGDNVTFSGTCSPDNLSVDITLTTATPSSITGCPCSSGTFTCPATVLTGFSTPVLAVKASNYSGSSNTQNVFTTRTAYAVAATPPTVYGLNMTMALDLSGPSSLPSNQVSITTSCYSAPNCDYGDWNPPGNTVGSFSLLGFSFLTSAIFADNSPTYWDLKGGTNRTVTVNFGASASSLDTTGSKYYFWIAMAGLGASPEYVEVTSNRSLRVIGYQDAFSTGDYSYLDGSATSLGSVGTVISTKPASGANGYTYYLIEDRTASTIQLSYVHGGSADFHGFILGAIEIRNQ